MDIGLRMETRKASGSLEWPVSHGKREDDDDFLAPMRSEERKGEWCWGVGGPVAFMQRREDEGRGGGGSGPVAADPGGRAVSEAGEATRVRVWYGEDNTKWACPV
jgi:hypothetical protein